MNVYVVIPHRDSPSLPMEGEKEEAERYNGETVTVTVADTGRGIRSDGARRTYVEGEGESER